MTIEPQDEIILEQGQYWRAVEAIPGEGIKKDMVLLLQSIRDVDKQAHTIVLRAHPSLYGRHVWRTKKDERGEEIRQASCLNEHRFLTADFLRLFVPEPGFESIRKLEIAKIQARIGELQEELATADFQAPDSLRKKLEEGTKAWEEKKQLPAGTGAMMASTAMVPLNTGITPTQVEGMKLAVEHKFEIATVKANWIKERVEIISETVKEMTPFFSERAAAALAKTEDVQRYVRKLESGIQSLDLYVGTGVFVIDIARGASAPADIPLTIMQRKLYADEELSVYAIVEDGFDFRSKDKFLENLATEPGLVNQIFPTERCVVSFAMRHTSVNYGDPIINDIINAKNRQVGLLVRDGENIYAVHSPIDSHLMSSRLFPSRAELDDIFKHKDFHSKNGREINYQDTLYTDKLSEHEAMSLHYKRFLILMAGLDHRINLFGTFYPGEKTMDFISVGFQQRYLSFIHDDDGKGMLPAVSKLDLASFLKRSNDYLRSGSRVFGNWNRAMNSRSAPGAVKRQGDGESVAYAPVETTSVRIARREGTEIVVDVPVSGYSYSAHADREFEARVSLSKVDEERGVPFIVLDAIKAKELESYIYDRTARQEHLTYIQFFKKAVLMLKEEAVEEKESRDKMRLAIQEAGVADPQQANDLVDRAVIAWRAINSGIPLPKFTSGLDKSWTTLLDQMYGLYKGEDVMDQAAAYAAREGYTPLRFIVDGSARYMLYCAPKPEEIDNRLTKQTEVHKISFRQTKAGLSVTKKSWAEVPKSSVSETIVKEWPEAEEWATLTSPITRDQKQEIITTIEQSWKETPPMFRDSVTWVEWEGLFDDFLAAVNANSMRNKSSVQNPEYFIPIGMNVGTKGSYENTVTVVKIIGIGTEDPAALLYNLATDEEQRKRLLDAHTRRYQRSLGARDKLLTQALSMKSGPRFQLCEVLVKARGIVSGFAHQYLGATPNFYGDSVKELTELSEQIKERASNRWYHSSISAYHLPDFISTMIGLSSPEELSWRECNNCHKTQESSQKRVRLDAPRRFQLTHIICDDCQSLEEEKYPGRAEEELTPYVPSADD